MSDKRTVTITLDGTNKKSVIPLMSGTVGPDVFDIRRDTAKSIAFGAGPHYCAGAFASRAMVADVALPGIFDRLKGLRLDEAEPVRIGGWAFRGLLNLPVRWDAA